MLDNYTVLDLEMTGLATKVDRIIEIGALRVRDKKVVAEYGMLVNPKMIVPQKVTELTGITNEMVQQGADMDKALSGLLDFIGDDVLVGHNIVFDYSFLKQWAVNKKLPLEMMACDTLKLARELLPPDQPKKLEALCEFFHINRENAHRAVDDARETYQIFEKLKAMEEAQEAKALKPYKLMYKARRQTPATKHQIERLKQIIEKYNIKDPINWDTLTRSEASRLQDQYCAKFGKL